MPFTREDLVLKLARTMIILTLPLILLFTSLEALVFREAYFNWQFSRYRIEEATGMESEDLLYTINQVMIYLRGGREDLVVISRIRGEEREIFGEREKDHMVDVRYLFRRGFQIRNFSLALFLASFTLLLKRRERITAAAALSWAGWLPLLMALLLAGAAALNFSRLFILFHEIFFDNDLWLLDPEREILIQMLPEGFFRDTTFLWGGLFSLLCVLAGVFSLLWLKRLRRLPIR